MMRRVFLLLWIASAALAQAQTAVPVSAAKKDLVARVIFLQQSAIEAMAREVVSRPAIQMGQMAGSALQRLAPEKREAAGKTIDTDIRRFIEEATPILRDRALQVAPAILGPLLEEKLSEDELRQVVAWLESPTARRFQQLGGEMQQSLGQKLAAEAGPLLDPKLMTLQQKVRGTLGIPSNASAPAASSSRAPTKAASVPRAASQ